MATISGNSDSNPIIYLGPDDLKFATLREMAESFLATYCPNWRNMTDPKSYMLPPVFIFKNPEITDKQFDKFMSTQSGTNPQNPSRPMAERISDNAKRIVFNAIDQCISDTLSAPFVAVRGLDLKLSFDQDKKFTGPLLKMFPQLSSEKLQEMMQKIFPKESHSGVFDFAIVGHKFGIVVVEVRTSSYKRDKHFKDGSRYLPENYKEGLANLDFSEALIYMLQQMTGVAWPVEARVRKIMFTPNLERSRFESWVATVNDAGRARIMEQIDHTIQWFQEDMINTIDHEDKAPLYSAFHAVIDDCQPIPEATYQAYAAMIAAIASINVQSNEKAITVRLNKSNFTGTS